MKGLTVFAACVLLSVGGQVAAQCTANRVSGGNTLLDFLGGKTVCATATGAGGSNAGDRWQEYHQTPGGAPNNLIEYAKGPTDPVDPTHPVGSWDASNGSNAAVTYNYGSGGSYTWLLYDDSVGAGTSYSFCTGENGSVVATATFLSGQVGCPGF